MDKVKKPSKTPCPICAANLVTEKLLPGDMKPDADSPKPSEMKTDADSFQKPSETGPSAEETKGMIQRAVTDLYLSIPYNISDREYRFDRAATSILTRLVDAAKRSAHLEDARAGCSYCLEPDLYGPALKQQTRKGDLRWRHVTSDGDTWLCERPEVWDALSILGGK